MKNDDYLWDKSGAPDAEIQRFERTLGSLRYKPAKHLNLPALLEAARNSANVEAIAQKRDEHRRRRIVPALAIAATLLMALTAGALWLRMRAPLTRSVAEAQFAIALPEATETLPSTPSAQTAASSSTPENIPIEQRGQTASFLAKPSRRKTFVAVAHPLLIARHEPARRVANAVMTEEGQRAKDQLMLALHIASETLSLAQKKAQVNKDDIPAS
ncbi:MAG: hypothetical protein ABR577_14655 [Pyrinomonadaceae bacterium]